MAAQDEFRIKAKVVDEATPALEQIAGAEAEVGNVIDATGQKAKIASEETNELLKHLGGMRSGKVAAMELFETMQGGGDTIAGLTNIMRLFALTSMEFLGPVGLAFAGVGLALAALVAKHDEHKKAAEESAKASEEFAKKQDEISKKKADEAIKRETDALRDLLKAQKDMDAEYGIQAGYAVQAIKDLEARTEATKKLQIAQMEQAKQEELAKATSQGERDRIEAKYKGMEAGVSDKAEGDKYKEQYDAFVVQATSANDERRAAQEQRANNQRAFDDLKKKADDTAAHAADLGVTPDESGSFEDAYKTAKDENHAATQTYNQDLADKRPPAQIQTDFDKVIETIPKVRAAFDAMTAQKSFEQQSKPLTDSIKSLDDKIDKLTAEYDHVLSQRATADVEHQANQADAGAKATADADAARKKKIEDDARDAEAALDVKRQQLQALLENPRNTDRQKASLQQQIDELDQQKLINEKNTKIATGDIAPGSNQARDYDARAAAIGAKGDAGIQKAEDKDADSQLAALMSEATAAVKASKNPALEAELKAFIDATKNDPLTRALDLMQVLAQLQASLGARHNSALDAMQKQLNDLAAQLNRQSHP